MLLLFPMGIIFDILIRVPRFRNRKNIYNPYFTVYFQLQSIFNDKQHLKYPCVYTFIYPHTRICGCKAYRNTHIIHVLALTHRKPLIIPLRRRIEKETNFFQALHTESEEKSPDVNFLTAIYLICSWIYLIFWLISHKLCIAICTYVCVFDKYLTICMSIYPHFFTGNMPL